MHVQEKASRNYIVTLKRMDLDAVRQSVDRRGNYQPIKFSESIILFPSLLEQDRRQADLPRREPLCLAETLRSVDGCDVSVSSNMIMLLNVLLNATGLQKRMRYLCEDTSNGCNKSVFMGKPVQTILMLPKSCR